MAVEDVIHVEVAWEVDPLTRPTDEQWVRLGSIDAELALETLTTSRGVNIRTGDIETGTATARIDDPNGNLDPSNTVSEWAPNVLPRRRIRFVVDPAAVPLFWGGDMLLWDGDPLTWDAEGETVLWTGYISSVPIQWRTAVQWTTLTAAGIFWLLAELSLPSSVLQAETVDSGPDHYWPLSETTGRVAEDVSGVLDGTYRLNPAEANLLPYAHGGQIFTAFSQEDKKVQHVSVGEFDTGTDWTWSVWFRADTNYPQDGSLSGVVYPALLVALDAYPTGDEYLTIRVETTGSRRGQLEVVYGNGTDYEYRGTAGPSVLDGLPHLLTVVGDGGTVSLFVDGGDTTYDIGSTGTPPTSVSGPMSFGQLPNTEEFPSFASTSPLRWQAGHYAFWSRILSAAEITALYSAGVDAWAGDLTGARLNRVLDLAGVDADDRDIAAGTQTCGPTTLDGANVMDYIRKIAATEGGPVGEDADGRIFLRNRTANDPTIVATFSDDPDGDGGTPPAAPLDPDFSLDRVVNHCKVTRENGATQEASAAASQSTFGPKTLNLETLHQSPSGSRSAATRQTIRNRDPRLVFPRVEANIIDTPSSVMTGTDIGDAVNVIARPPRGGDPIEQTSIVERVEHNLAGGESWSATFGVVEHTVLPDFWWDEPGQGWDESVWAS